MKYTKKQIYNAFLKWEIEKRTNPAEFMTEDEINNTNADCIAEKMTKELIKNIK